MSYRDHLALRIASYSPCEQVGLLYEALLENISEMQLYLADPEALQKRADHSREILAHLIASFTEEDESTHSARQIYLYVNERITAACLNKQPQCLQEARQVLVPLREMWAELAKREKDEALPCPQAPRTGDTYGRSDVCTYVEPRTWDKA